MVRFHHSNRYPVMTHEYEYDETPGNEFLDMGDDYLRSVTRATKKLDQLDV